MKIIIAGAGEVGTHLAQSLSREEEQEITLIDPQRAVVTDLKKHLDAYILQGNPTYLEDLKRAQVQSADLFISVMPGESENLLACMMASQLGAKSTIARINNHIFLQSEYKRLFEKFGVDRLVYPEELAAENIADSFKYPWARIYIELLNGAFVLVGVKVRNGSELVNRKLNAFKSEGEKRLHVVAIKRFSQTIIPTGESVIEHGDVVFFICLSKDVELIRRLANKRKRTVKDVVLLGGSRIALRTIEKSPSHLRFHLIENNPDKLKNIENSLAPNVRIYEADGRDLAVLEEIGMDTETVFVALTQNSETNILACLAAKRYDVCKTIAKEENIDYIPLAERLDIGTIINKKLIAAGYIYRELLGADTNSVKSLTIAEADVAELQVRYGSKITQKPVKDLGLPSGITLGGLIRNGVAQMINGDTLIQPYDNVVVFCTEVAMSKLSRWFSA